MSIQVLEQAEAMKKQEDNEDVPLDLLSKGKNAS